jgi:hypothetical protein
MPDKSQAKHELAIAVEDAKKVIANATAEALRVSRVAISNDHDLLIRIETKLQQVISDVNDIKTNTVARIDKIEVDYVTRVDHEKVVNDIVALKTWKNGLIGVWGVASGVLVFLAIALFNHLTGAK